MALGRSLTKKLKKSVTKTFGTTQTDDKTGNNDCFYAINFNDTDPSLQTPISTSSLGAEVDKSTDNAGSVHSMESSNSSIISRANSIKRSPTDSLKRASSLLSRKSSTSSKNTRTPSISKSPSMTSSPSTPTTYSFPVTPISPISDAPDDDYVTYYRKHNLGISDAITMGDEEIHSMLPPSAPFSLKYPPSHRTIPSTSSAHTGASSCYSSINNDYSTETYPLNSYSSSNFPTKGLKSLQEESLADEVAMKILEKVSAEEYAREIKAGTWTI